MIQAHEGRKLLLSYNINPEDSQEYYRFVLGRYIPVMQAFGLEVSEAWHTAYGDYPNRLVGFVSKDQASMDQVLSSDVWQELNDELLDYVSDFSYKIIRYEFGFQF